MLKINTLIELAVGVTIKIESDGKVIATQSPYPGTPQVEYSIVLTDRLWIGPSIDDILSGRANISRVCWKAAEYVGYSDSGGIYVHELTSPSGHIQSHNLRSLHNLLSLSEYLSHSKSNF
jgi:hypothetical protein